MKSMFRMTDAELSAHIKRLQNQVPKAVHLPPPKITVRKPSKYGNVATNGYASAREAHRAADLRLLERSGAIRDLKEQVYFELIPAQYVDGKCAEKPCAYVADFTYDELPGHVTEWIPIVEDCKGARTEVYRIKRKLMLQKFGIRIRET